MLTAEEKADAHIWKAAHDLAEKEFHRVKSGACAQPGLAATLAIFAVKMVRAERERCLKAAEYGIERAVRDWTGRDAQDAAELMAREIAEVIRSEA